MTGFVPGKHAIESYGNGGFRFAGMSHQGSIIALPTGIQSWFVSSPARIDVPSLTAVLAEAYRLDMLLIGTGEKALPQMRLLPGRCANWASMSKSWIQRRRRALITSSSKRDGVWALPFSRCDRFFSTGGRPCRASGAFPCACGAPYLPPGG